MCPPACAAACWCCPADVIAGEAGYLTALPARRVRRPLGEYPGPAGRPRHAAPWPDPDHRSDSFIHGRKTAAPDPPSLSETTRADGKNGPGRMFISPAGTRKFGKSHHGIGSHSPPSNPLFHTELDGRSHGVARCPSAGFPCLCRFRDLHELACLDIEDVPVNRDIIGNQWVMPYAQNILHDTFLLI
jgi:hypothetical protein